MRSRPTLSRILRRWLERATATPPIIVAGMHRSGTSLLARLLEAAGVCMGYRKHVNFYESVCFLHANRWLLENLGASWRSLDYLPSHDEISRTHARWMAARLRVSLSPLAMAGHFGPRLLAVLSGRDVRWGWKDPRNSLLLPVWREVFPEAIVVHIYRDGRNVALSLLNRDEKL